MKRILRLLSPYIAVGIFWCVFSNAWLAILAYHLQVVCWSKGSFSGIRRPTKKMFVLMTLPMMLGGPVLYFLLPYAIHTDLSLWLAEHHLSRLSLMIMIPYFGVVHPFLEQLHWGKLREETWLAHPLFAGYHMIVLYSLLSLPWLVISFVVLASASWVWRELTDKSNSLVPAIVSHVLVDGGVIVAAWLQAY